MSSPYSSVQLSALASLHTANLHFSPSVVARRGTNDSTFSNSFPLEDDTSSHNHHLFHSFHLIRETWRDQSWAHVPQRHELIALGHASNGRRALGWHDVREEFARLSGLRRGGMRGWASGPLPVAGGVGVTEQATEAWVGWTVKGATW